jgi:hypothetical protein
MMARPEHRDCIAPPAPRRGLLRLLRRSKVTLIPKPMPPSKKWRDIEETAVDTVRPGKQLKEEKGMEFEVCDLKTDRCIGTVEGENYMSAALEAARCLFGKETARRETGWAGHTGEFSAFDLGEEKTIRFRLTQCLNGASCPKAV